MIRSNPRWTPVWLMLLAWIVGTPRQAWADDDPWFGADKGLHFGASAVLAASGYAVGTLVFEQRSSCAWLGAGVAMTAGVGKELCDAAGYGSPSLRDLVWDGVGTAVGLGLAWSLDLLIRGQKRTETASPSTEAPVYPAPSISQAAWSLRF